MSTPVGNSWTFAVYAIVAIVAAYLARDIVFPLDRWNTSQTRCVYCLRDMMHKEQHHERRRRGDGKIDDLADPLYNVREAAKQCEALEDHLEHLNKRCMDCIRKHFLMIEVLLEEAVGLDRYGKHQALLCGKAERVRRIMSEFNKTHDFLRTAQAIRDLRKRFVNASFNIV